MKREMEEKWDEYLQEAAELLGLFDSERQYVFDIKDIEEFDVRRVVVEIAIKLSRSSNPVFNNLHNCRTDPYWGNSYTPVTS